MNSKYTWGISQLIHSKDFFFFRIPQVQNGVAKIADAGLNGHTYTASGTYIPTTIAPEVFLDEYFDDAESDIYSIGILMWEIYYGRPAFTCKKYDK